MFNFKRNNNNAVPEDAAQREALQRAISNREQIQLGGQGSGGDSTTTNANIAETKKNAFAALEGNPADEVAAIREAITNRQQLNISGDGTLA